MRGGEGDSPLERKLPSSLKISFTTSQCMMRPRQLVTSVVTWFWMMVVRVAALKPPLLTQLGSCECHT